MKGVKPRQLLRRIAWPVLLVGALGLVLSAVVVARGPASASSQPIDFSHRVHAENAVLCLYCHSSPLRSDVAGIPSVQLCVGCHRTIASEQPQVQALLSYWDRGLPIPWEPVVQMPDFVFFSHQPHLGSGVSCETCHGDVGGMNAARRAIEMDMGWCLRCHLDQSEETVGRLTDCLTCHQ
jgi:hypothetical protein